MSERAVFIWLLSPIILIFLGIIAWIVYGDGPVCWCVLSASIGALVPPAIYKASEDFWPSIDGLEEQIRDKEKEFDKLPSELESLREKLDAAKRLRRPR